MKTRSRGVLILTLLVPTSLYGQHSTNDYLVESTQVSENNTFMADSSVNLNAPVQVSFHDHEGGYKAHGSHMVSDRHIPSYISPVKLQSGKTYNRYGDLVSPKGYGIQVVSFRKTKNLCKYLHLYHTKEMYIQVVTLDSNLKIYRVILGADENKGSVEHEIQLFQRAGLQAVLRKHK